MTALEPTYLEAPAQISGQELRRAYLGLQEGVFDAGDLKVTAGGGTREVVVAAGRAMIQGDAITDQGLYEARNDANVSSNTSSAGAFEAGGIPAADATNPRVDQVVARVYDASHDGSGQRKWRPEVIAGVATAGATLDNRNGAAALPTGAVRLADVLVPAGATTISAGNVRDRRPWARGAFRQITRTAGDYTTIGTAMALIDSVNLQPRIECSGVPVKVALSGRHMNSGANFNTYAVWVDGAPFEVTATAPFSHSFPAGAEHILAALRDFVPTAGSRLLGVAWAVTAGTGTVRAQAAAPLKLTIEEVVRQNADNG